MTNSNKLPSHIKFDNHTYAVVGKSEDDFGYNYLAYPIGGGFQIEVARHLCTPCEAPTFEPRLGFVQHENYPGQHFLSLVDPEDRWNGWATPEFTTAQMSRVMKVMGFKAGELTAEDDCNSDPKSKVRVHYMLPEKPYPNWEATYHDCVIHSSTVDDRVWLDGWCWENVEASKLSLSEICQLDTQWQPWPLPAKISSDPDSLGSGWEFAVGTVGRDSDLRTLNYCNARFPGLLLRQDEDQLGVFTLGSLIEVERGGGKIFLLHEAKAMTSAEAIRQAESMPLLQKCWVNGVSAERMLGPMMTASAWQGPAAEVGAWQEIPSKRRSIAREAEKTYVNEDYPGVVILPRQDGQFEVASAYLAIIDKEAETDMSLQEIKSTMQELYYDKKRRGEVDVLISYGTYESMGAAVACAERVKVPSLQLGTEGIKVSNRFELENLTLRQSFEADKGTILKAAALS